MQNKQSNVMNQPVELTFDETAARYKEELNRGVSLTGENPEFFAKSRLTWVAQRLAKWGSHPKKALDFGCGTGGGTPYFFQAFESIGECVGTDPSPKSLEVAREQATQLGLNASYFSTPQEAQEARGPVDMAFCNGVFHHIVPEERPAALRSVWEILKPGGWFVFSENNPWNPMMRYAMSRVSFDKDAILISPPEAKRLLATAGFEVRGLDFLFFFPRLLAFCRPVESLLTRLPVGAQYMVFVQRPQ